MCEETKISSHICYNKTIMPPRTKNPIPAELAAQWHPSKNGSLLPTAVTAGSDKKVWWVCELGHEWEAKVYNRTQGRGCGVCSGNILLVGFNDLATTHPHLAKQWHPTKNLPLTPSDVRYGTKQKIHWITSCGHDWYDIPARRNVVSQCSECYKEINSRNPLSLNQTISAEWHPTKNNSLVPSQVSIKSAQKVWWLCSNGHEWEAPVYSRTSNKPNGCPFCSKSKSFSVAEEEISSFLEAKGFKVVKNDRTALNGKEIDIFVPEKQVGIEFNGLYWHDEYHKPKMYHQDKYEKAKAAGIKLIQIWEDDWESNSALLKTMLEHKLGVSRQRKVYARTLQVRTLTSQEAKAFFNQHHIQKFGSGSYYLGLEDLTTSQVVAVMSLKKESGTESRTLNIVRYATSCNVVGGFTKLLKHAERTYQPESFITFADHCVSDGGLYENNGFVADKELPPDYMYVVNGQRKHKFGYRLKKFRDDPSLFWEEGLSERELAALNNLPRIWDAGKTRYRKMC